MSISLNFKSVKKISKNKSDLLGSLSSGICLIHCLATPFLFVAYLGESENHHVSSPIWWQMIDFAFLVVSFLAVYWSAKNTSKKWMKAALYISWAFLAIVLLNEKLSIFHWVEEVIYLPAIALIALHLYNRKYCHSEKDACAIHIKH